MVTTSDSKLNGRAKEINIRSIVVEYAEDIADSIRYNLERQGFRVRVASTGQAALDIIFYGPVRLSDVVAYAIVLVSDAT
ncbi:MAG TPA: hypothetical protein VF762_06405 [Blastocatellia bacterium]|jgi:DNA-binding response OmpR family regulator